MLTPTYLSVNVIDHGTRHAAWPIMAGRCLWLGIHTGRRRDGSGLCLWHGWLWRGGAYQEAKSLVKMEGLQDIIAVACGWRHAVALDHRGSVFGWGWNRYAQLGQGDKMMAVHRLPLPRPIVQIACGHLHTLLLDDDGKVSCLGSNKHGQQSTPDTRFTSVSSGWHHCGGVDEGGVLSMWGRNDHHQLLNEKGVAGFICGSEHTLALYRESQVVIAWGWNEHGNCGPSANPSPSPISLPKGGVVLLGAGCATSWIGLSSS